MSDMVAATFGLRSFRLTDSSASSRDDLVELVFTMGDVAGKMAAAVRDSLNSGRGELAAVRKTFASHQSFQDWRRLQHDQVKTEQELTAAGARAAECLDKAKAALAAGTDPTTWEDGFRRAELDKSVYAHRRDTLTGLVAAAKTAAETELASLLLSRQQELLTAAEHAYLTAADAVCQAVAAHLPSLRAAWACTVLLALDPTALANQSLASGRREDRRPLHVREFGMLPSAE